MITTISNGRIRFTSDSRNVESLFLGFTDEDINYIWRPSNGGSAGTCICFPLLGSLPENHYLLHDRQYTMKTHGFADQADFSAAAEKDQVIYELRDSESTREVFPYRFVLQVIYRVSGEELQTEYSVFNPGDRALPFSVGGHPRIACPMDPAEGLRFEDYTVVFDKPEGADKVVKSYGPVEIIARHFSKDGMTLSLSDELFTEGCFCLSPLASGHVKLCSVHSGRAVEMTPIGVSNFQLWKAVGAPFLALEPWYGSITSIPPKAGDDDWLARKGTILLPPGERYTCSYGIRIIRQS